MASVNSASPLLPRSTSLSACLPLLQTSTGQRIGYCGAGGAAPKAGPMATGSTRGTPAAGQGICSGGSPILQSMEAGRHHIAEENLGRTWGHRCRMLTPHPPPQDTAHSARLQKVGSRKISGTHRKRRMKVAMASAVRSGSSSCTACPACSRRRAGCTCQTTGLAQAAHAAAPPAAAGKAGQNRLRSTPTPGLAAYQALPCGSSTGWNLPHQRAAQAPTAKFNCLLLMMG